VRQGKLVGEGQKDKRDKRTGTFLFLNVQATNGPFLPVISGIQAQLLESQPEIYGDLGQAKIPPTTKPSPSTSIITPDV
jgi:hypothetical protein